MGHARWLDGPELAGVVLGAWGVWLTARRSLWLWPVSIADSLVFAGVFGRSGLYAAAGMQLLYAVLAVLGWHWWRQGGSRQERLPLSRVAAPAVLALTVLVLTVTPLLTLLLRHAHDVAPWADALAAALSLAGQYLVMRKRLENWYLWLAADGVYVALNVSHHLFLFGGMYVAHAFMCVWGLRQWHLALAAQPPPSSPGNALLV